MAAVVPLANLLKDIAARLTAAGIADPGYESRLIIRHFTGVDFAAILLSPDAGISGEQVETIELALARRLAGEPVHRILGRRAFYGVELALSRGTLEPRPDTEILVDRIIPHARRIMATEGRCKMLDLGTGTGAIALALLAEVDGVEAVGTDIDADAVRTASANARANGLAARFRAVQSDWFERINEKFHVIVSNPPYISVREFGSLPSEVRNFDPETALNGGLDGLDAYRSIAQSVAGHLLPGGIVGCEIGYRQREAVTALFAESGFDLLEQTRDLAGNDRVLIFTC